MSLELVPTLSNLGSEFVVDKTPGGANDSVGWLYEANGFDVSFCVKAPETLSSCSSSWRIRDFNFSPISHGKKLSVNRPQSHSTTYGVHVELRDFGFFSSLSDRSYSPNLPPLRIYRATQTVGKECGKVLYVWSGLKHPGKADRLLQEKVLISKSSLFENHVVFNAGNNAKNGDAVFAG